MKAKTREKEQKADIGFLKITARRQGKEKREKDTSWKERERSFKKE